MITFDSNPTSGLTPTLGTSTTGVIDTGVQNPSLSFTGNLPDGTDDFSIGSWVKLDTTDPITFNSDFEYTTQGVADNDWVPASPSTFGRVNISTETLDFDFDNSDGSADKQIYHDLTSVDTDWVLRMKLNWSALVVKTKGVSPITYHDFPMCC